MCSDNYNNPHASKFFHRNIISLSSKYHQTISDCDCAKLIEHFCPLYASFLERLRVDQIYKVEMRKEPEGEDLESWISKYCQAYKGSSAQHKPQMVQVDSLRSWILSQFFKVGAKPLILTASLLL